MMYLSLHLEDGTIQHFKDEFNNKALLLRIARAQGGANSLYVIQDETAGILDLGWTKSLDASIDIDQLV